ncbi:PREDICTED: myosin-binding protein 7-like [Ipomoea nil]|uniref:myosin-binding protein 7-like n=1 Tax=Ipomoea nil TaxID=35883 RepID=UPI0009011E8F|nr:PREDICTED: myosin-binding protein 7-like [Ipomoea nil]
MGSENMSPSTSMAQCCDCDCSCSAADRSIAGSWLRSVKRKYDEFDDSVSSVPEFVMPLTAKVEIGNECAALREMVSGQQKSIQDLSKELDAERNASSSAANEAMQMILRLEREKAEIQMEFTQFKRFTEEKTAHEQQEALSLEDLLYKRDQAIEALTCEVQMYKHRMLSLGFTESEVEVELEKERDRLSCNNSLSENSNGQSEVPQYEYPPLKCFNENQVYKLTDGEDVDVEKYAFGETPRTPVDHFLDLDSRIIQLERSPMSPRIAQLERSPMSPRIAQLERNPMSPRISHPDGDFYKNNALEKVIVGQSPRRPSHLKMFSNDSAGSLLITNKEMSYDFVVESPKSTVSFKKTEISQKDDLSNLRKVDNASEVEDCMSDRVYTIDPIHLGAAPYNGVIDRKPSLGICEDYITTPRDSLIYTNTEDIDIKKLYARLHALEADRESMRQALISISTDNSQLVLLKEIAQQLAKDMSQPKRRFVKKPSTTGSFKVVSIFKWMISFVSWRKKSRRCKYMFGLSGSNAGLLVLLDKGPRGPWRCISSTQV